MSATKFHTHTKQLAKIIVLYILIFKFLDSNLEDKRFCTEWCRQGYRNNIFHPLLSLQGGNSCLRHRDFRKTFGLLTEHTAFFCKSGEFPCVQTGSGLLQKPTALFHILFCWFSGRNMETPTSNKSSGWYTAAAHETRRTLFWLGIVLEASCSRSCYRNYFPCCSMAERQYIGPLRVATRRSWKCLSQPSVISKLRTR